MERMFNSFYWNRSLILFLILIFLTPHIFAEEYEVMKIINSSNHAVLKSISDNSIFVEKNDYLSLRGYNSDCQVKVLKSQKDKVLVSLKNCNFRVDIGQKAVFSDSSDDTSIKRGVASENNDINNESHPKSQSNFQLKDFTYLGFNYMNKPGIEHGGSDSLDYKDFVGASLGHNKFIKEYNGFIDAGLDIMVGKTKEKLLSVTPIALYANYGMILSKVNDDNFPIYIKAFVGLGLSYSIIEGVGELVKESMELEFDSSLGFLYQFGIGIISKNFFIDLIFRSISSTYTVKGYDLVFDGHGDYTLSDKKYERDEDFDLSLKPMLRLGFFF